MRLRRFDRHELTVFVTSWLALVAIGIVGFAVLLKGTPWWAVLLYLVLLLVWLVRYERWFQRRHPAEPAAADA